MGRCACERITRDRNSVLARVRAGVRRHSRAHRRGEYTLRGAAWLASTPVRRKHGYLSGGGLYACCRCKLAPGYRLRNRTRSHCMNIICIQVGYMAGAGISWLARINDYMEPTDVGGPATPRTPRLALYLLRPPTPFTLALSLNALLMATAYNLWRPLFKRHPGTPLPGFALPPPFLRLFPEGPPRCSPRRSAKDSRDWRNLGCVFYTPDERVSSSVRWNKLFRTL